MGGHFLGSLERHPHRLASHNILSCSVYYYNTYFSYKYHRARLYVCHRKRLLLPTFKHSFNDQANSKFGLYDVLDVLVVLNAECLAVHYDVCKFSIHLSMCAHISITGAKGIQLMPYGNE